jgi:hypothetical protein
MASPDRANFFTHANSMKGFVYSIWVVDAQYICAD